MRVLVTGAFGFIGSALVPALEAHGHKVRAPGRHAPLEPELEGCDVVVHLANLAHGGFDRETLWRVNVEGTRTLAKAAAMHGVRRLIYLSSIKASGEETLGRPFDGSEHPMPQDEYGKAKLAAEEALAAVSRDEGLEIVALRPPLVYGPGVKANFRSLMRAVAARLPLPFAAMENRRSLLYAGNLAEAVCCCLVSPHAAGKVFVVGDAPPLSTAQLCTSIGIALGRRVHLFYCPRPLLELVPSMKKLTRSLEVDSSALRRQLGWSPRYSLEEGMRATADWYQRR